MRTLTALSLAGLPWPRAAPHPALRAPPAPDHRPSAAPEPWARPQNRERSAGWARGDPARHLRARGTRAATAHTAPARLTLPALTAGLVSCRR